MAVRTLSPFGFETGGGMKPSNMRIAVGVSLAVHVAAGLYLAYAHFAPPVQKHEPAEQIFTVPIVTVKPDKPKPLDASWPAPRVGCATRASIVARRCYRWAQPRTSKRFRPWKRRFATSITWSSRFAHRGWGSSVKNTS